jgi:hypothetical protein
VGDAQTIAGPRVAGARPAGEAGSERLSRAERLTVAAGAAIALITVSFGLIASEAGLGLGTALPPFFATWDPQIADAGLLWLALAAAAAAIALIPARGAGPPLVFCIAVPALAVVSRLAVTASREGTGG